MHTGIITHFNENRGFGFIRPDNGQADIFIHASQVRSGARLVEGLAVSFDIGANERTGKEQAVRVVVL
jgi:CspA family cold shock protein